LIYVYDGFYLLLIFNGAGRTYYRYTTARILDSIHCIFF
jgi:hypothetical protein